MALCEDFRAFGSCLLSSEVKAFIHDEVLKLLNTDGLLDPGYSEMMRGTLAAMFPLEAPQEQLAASYQTTKGKSR
jgi:hypothetical protein